MIFQAPDIDQAGGVVKDIELPAAEIGFVFLQGGTGIFFDGSHEILFALLGKPADPFFVVDDDELPRLAVSGAGSETGIFENFADNLRGHGPFLIVPNGSPPGEKLWEIHGDRSFCTPSVTGGRSL
jgi:hypothetical protein